MPEINGLELAEELHKIKPRIPVILMTGYGKDIYPATLSSCYGISKFLKKPIKLTDVAVALNDLLPVRHV